MQIDVEACERARQTRDPRFDGRFFIGVVTTGVYCRPVCAVRMPKRENVRFYVTAAAAAEAGFRPCLRCRPESAPGSPAWRGTGSTVARALRLLEDGALDGGGLPALAARLGVGERHLRRVFVEHVGAPPVTFVRTRRLHFAKKLIEETELSMAEVAFAAGFGSVRAFNDAIASTYARTPRSLRRRHERRASDELGATPHALTLLFKYRPPLDWPALVRFLGVRAAAGIEEVEGDVYRRTIEIEGDDGVLSAMASRGDAIRVTIGFSNPSRALEIATRARRMFDLTADPHEIAQRLGRDRVLRSLVTTAPGLRLPGAWDGFELAVRAILGQQVNVRAARTLAGRVVHEYGRPLAHGATATLSRVFPSPEVLARARLAPLGMPEARARAVRLLSSAVARGHITFDGSTGSSELTCRLMAIAGVGPWTAEYIAMRALGEPDAFPVDDAGVRRALGESRDAIAKRAEAWRPWRAYAVMHLWRSLEGGARATRRRAG